MATPDDLDCGNLNTTECVLKYLKSIAQSQKVQTDDFNWDPISVYITAAIGGIALCLAIVTIGHAVFSSAHGRFKASQYAIGPWHMMSNSYLNWTEMRVGTVMYTPIISIAQFTQLHNDDRAKRVQTKTSFDFDDRIERLLVAFCRCYLICVTPINFCIDYLRYCRAWVQYISKYIKYARDVLEGANVQMDKPSPPDLSTWRGQKGLDECFPAQWLCLLTCLGLDYPNFWPVRPLGLDYIPGDLTAAPAWGPIRDICILVLLAAFGRNHPITVAFDKEPKLPRIYSDWFDFHFEKHPQLGHLAVFHILKQSSQTELFINVFMKPDIRDRIQSRLAEAFGSMRLVMGPDRTIDFVDQAAMESKTAYLPWAVSRRNRLNKELEEIMENCREVPDAHESTHLPDSRITLSPDMIAAIGSVTQPFEIMFAQPKREPPEVFPCNRFYIWDQITSLLLLNHRWLADPVKSKEMFQEVAQWAGRVSSKRLRLQWVDELKGVMKRLDDAFSASPTQSYLVGDISRLDKRKQEVLKHPEWDTYSAADDVNVIDMWLEAHAPKVTSCRKATLSVLATAARNLVLNDPPGPSTQSPGGDDNSLEVSSDFIIASTQRCATQAGSVLRSLAQKHNFQGRSESLDAYNAYKIELMSQIQDPARTESSRLDCANKLAAGGQDELIHAMLEVGQHWNDEFYADQGEATRSSLTYTGHPIDHLIITRSILVGLTYLSAENDSSWVLDGQEDWNQAVSFL